MVEANVPQWGPVSRAVECLNRQCQKEHDGQGRHLEPSGPVGFDDLPQAHDAPRLRILPNVHGDPRHYLVLDRLEGLDLDKVEPLVEAVQDSVPVPVLAFAFEVDLPDVDDDYRDGDEELVQWPMIVGGTRALGPELIGTAEEPGEPGSVLNWRGVNYVPQADPEPNGISADDRERLGDDTCPGGC